MSPTRAWKTSPLPIARTQSLYLDTQEEEKQNRIIQLEEELIKQRQEAEIKEIKMREMEEAMRRLKEKLALYEEGMTIQEGNEHVADETTVLED